MNALTQRTAVPPQSGLIPRNMSEAMQLAEMMARGKMMPDHLKNPGDALMVVEQAMRWNMSPFAVAQSTYNIKGKLLFAGTIVAAAIENSGAIQGLIDYQFSGEGEERKITVSATRRGEATPRTVEVLLKDARTTNEIWKKQPDQQLVYHGARVWARRWTPGVMLGVYTPEEWRERPVDTFAGTTIDAEPLSTGQVIGDEIPDGVSHAPPSPPPTKKHTFKDWLGMMELRLAGADTLAELDAIVMEPESKRMAGLMTNGSLERWKELLANNVERLNESHPGYDRETGEVLES